MPSGSAVLDANVLVPIALCDLLIRLGEAGIFEPLLTEEILAEVERTLVHDLGIARSGARWRVGAMRAAPPVTMIAGYESLIATMPNDPDDRHVLAAAVHAGARVIVTQNLRHFPENALAPYGVAAQSADRFLLDRFAADREAVMVAIRAQAAALTRPPQSPEQVLTRLAVEAPRFARAVYAAMRDAQ
ncbi:MAG: PIN domain-containing protein [Thermomicrobiales bacterium]